jgi:xanthine dehydrogenase molybdenum-binding subunit
MKAEGLLARKPAPSREEIAHGLAGNLCRCTGYVKVIDAIEQVAAVRRGEAPAAARAAGGGIGERVDRWAGRELALGEQEFVADMVVPGMLHGALRLSDHPRATVRRIDTSRAAAAPGVVAVVTAADVPGERLQGLIEHDWPVFVA